MIFTHVHLCLKNYILITNGQQVLVIISSVAKNLHLDGVSLNMVPADTETHRSIS